MPAQGWEKEARCDSSLVYRHTPTGCTLQRIRRGAAVDAATPGCVWLLFTRTYELIDVLEGADAAAAAPLEAAGNLLRAMAVENDPEPARPTIDLSRTYRLIPGDE